MARDVAFSPPYSRGLDSLSRESARGKLALFGQSRSSLNCGPDLNATAAFHGIPWWSANKAYPRASSLYTYNSAQSGASSSLSFQPSRAISSAIEQTLEDGDGSLRNALGSNREMETLEDRRMVAFQPQEKSSQAVRSGKLLVAGGLAGAIARTCTAPLDRIKLLFQVQALGQGGTSANSYTGVWQALSKIYREEGFRAYWKGNFTNIIRIVPYSASQFMSHEQYKAMLAGPDGKLTTGKRLTAGGMAGITCSALTHPLDTVRLRLAMPSSGYTGMTNAFITIVTKEGYIALYKGLAPTLIGIAPYAALNFASYDMLKNFVYGEGKDRKKQYVVQNLLIGATAGTLATTVCYPLDTIRRRMQMKGKNYTSIANAFTTMARTEGIRSFYKGWAANTLKVIPQNSIRFVSFELIKTLVGVAGSKTDT